MIVDCINVKNTLPLVCIVPSTVRAAKTFDNPKSAQSESTRYPPVTPFDVSVKGSQGTQCVRTEDIIDAKYLPPVKLSFLFHTRLIRSSGYSILF